jgi:hypothetical protein
VVVGHTTAVMSAIVSEPSIKREKRSRWIKRQYCERQERRICTNYKMKSVQGPTRDLVYLIRATGKMNAVHYICTNYKMKSVSDTNSEDCGQR